MSDAISVNIAQRMLYNLRHEIVDNGLTINVNVSDLRAVCQQADLNGLRNLSQEVLQRVADNQPEDFRKSVVTLKELRAICDTVLGIKPDLSFLKDQLQTPESADPNPFEWSAEAKEQIEELREEKEEAKEKYKDEHGI